MALPGVRGAAATERCFAFHGCLGPSCSQARLWSVVNRSQASACAMFELCAFTEAMRSSHVRFVAADLCKCAAMRVSSQTGLNCHQWHVHAATLTMHVCTIRTGNSLASLDAMQRSCAGGRSPRVRHLPAAGCCAVRVQCLHLRIWPNGEPPDTAYVRPCKSVWRETGRSSPGMRGRGQRGASAVHDPAV